MKLKIKVTRDIIKQAMWCGTVRATGETNQNCAIALAVRDVFPNAVVWMEKMFLTPVMLTKSEVDESKSIVTYLDADTSYFIQDFDSRSTKPETRLSMPKYEFEIEVPEDIVEQINIADIHASATLELV